MGATYLAVPAMLPETAFSHMTLRALSTMTHKASELVLIVLVEKHAIYAIVCFPRLRRHPWRSQEVSQPGTG